MPSERLRVAIHGAAGRMGQRLVQLISESNDLTLACAIERPDHAELGKDAGAIAGKSPLGTRLAHSLAEAADVAIDFTAPAASLAFAEVAARQGVPLVVGTTGFRRDEREALLAHAKVIPLMLEANFSKAVNLLFLLAESAAKALGPNVDVEIVERHHHFKKDAPSGTALRLAQGITNARGPMPLVHGRRGETGERPSDEIGMHALRSGDNPGEHTVVFGLLGECIELSHRALNRDGFARGALDAARFLAGKTPGVYTMADLLRP